MIVFTSSLSRYDQSVSNQSMFVFILHLISCSNSSGERAYMLKARRNKCSRLFVLFVGFAF